MASRRGGYGGAALTWAPGSGRLPRGELWLYDRVFHDVGLPVGIAGQWRLRSAAGMDRWCLPIGEAPDAVPGYRSYRPEELPMLRELQPAPFLGLIVDGPLEREIRRVGLTEALAPLAAARRGHAPAAPAARGAQPFGAATAAALALIRATAGWGEAVIVADDIAGGDRLLASPRALSRTLLPRYAELAAAVHDTRRLALFHSDGALGEFLRPLRRAGFDGLAAYQPEALSAPGIRARAGADCLRLGGIPAEWVRSGALPSQTEVRAHLRSLTEGGGCLGLATSCGIEDGAAWQRLMACYALLDGA